MTTKRKWLVALSSLVMLYAIANLLEMFLTEKRERQKIEELAIVWQKDKEDTVEEDADIRPLILLDDEVESELKMLLEFEQLYERNMDIVGWLKIAGTRIDYPIMQNLQEPDFYLNHDFDQAENSSGLPFLDKHSRTDGSGIMLIHGHHMKNGWMFKDLMKYKKQDFYKEHRTFQFSTLYEQGEYEIIAVIVSQVYRQSDDVFKYYQIEKVNTPDEFDSYVQHIKQLALYDTGVTAEYGDRLIVLSTCEYSSENGRLAVIARKLNNNG